MPGIRYRDNRLEDMDLYYIIKLFKNAVKRLNSQIDHQEWDAAKETARLMREYIKITGEV